MNKVILSSIASCLLSFAAVAGNDVSEKIEDLGNEVLANAFTNLTKGAAYTRNVWTMQAFDGKVFFGGGNSANGGPGNWNSAVRVYSYDPGTEAFATSNVKIASTQIDRMRIIDGKLYVPGHDPTTSASANGNYYYLASGTKNWTAVTDQIPGYYGIHSYDIADFEDKLAVCGYGTSISTTLDGTGDWSSVPSAWLTTVDYMYRFPTFLQFPSAIYAIGYKNSTALVTGGEEGVTIYGRDGNYLVQRLGAGESVFSDVSESFSFAQIYPDTTQPTVGTENDMKVSRSVAFGSKVLYIGGITHLDHQCWPVGLYSATDGTSTFTSTRITFSSDASAQPWYLMVANGKVYLLWTTKSGDLWTNHVSSSSDGTNFTEEFCFNYRRGGSNVEKVFARSMAYFDGYFYFGLGTEIADHGTAKKTGSLTSANIKLTVSYSVDEMSEYAGTILRYKESSEPEPTPTEEGYANLGSTATDRFALPSDQTWPADEYGAEVCLWKYDRFAACSAGHDDNCAWDIPFLKNISSTYGIPFTWWLITAHIGEAKYTSQYGTWEGWKELFDEGGGKFAIESHSDEHLHGAALTNAAESAGVSVEDYALKMYTNSFAQLTANIGNQPTTLAWVGAEPHQAVLSNCCVSARGGAKSPNQANQIDYLNVNASSGGAQPGYLNIILGGMGGTKTTPQNLNKPDKRARYRRGWFVPFLHTEHTEDGQPQSGWETTVASNVLDYATLGSHRKHIWLGTYPEVAKYSQSYCTHSLAIGAKTASSITFTLTDKMRDDWYDEPLTVKIRLPDAWSQPGVAATQGGETLDAFYVEHENMKYALVNAVPDAGEVTIVPAAANSGTWDETSYETPAYTYRARYLDENGAVVSYTNVVINTSALALAPSLEKEGYQLSWNNLDATVDAQSVTNDLDLQAVWTPTPGPTPEPTVSNLCVLGWTVCDNGEATLSDSQRTALATEFATNHPSVAYLTGFLNTSSLSFSGYEVSAAKTNDVVIPVASNAGYGEIYAWKRSVFVLDKEFDAVFGESGATARSIVLHVKGDPSRRYVFSTYQCVWGKNSDVFTAPITNDIAQVEAYLGENPVEGWFVGYSTRVMNKSDKEPGIQEFYESKGFSVISDTDNFKLYLRTGSAITRLDEYGLSNAAVSTDSTNACIVGSVVRLSSYVPYSEWDVPGKSGVGGIKGFEDEVTLEKYVVLGAIARSDTGLTAALSAVEIQSDNDDYVLICKTDLKSDETFELPAKLTGSGTEGLFTVVQDLTGYPTLFIVGVGPAA